MLKGRSRDPRVVASPTPAHLNLRTPTQPRAPLARPEPDYEVVEFPSDQYVNAKLQPPPPPPPRPPTGHPAEAASCGLCGGGGARVRCTECGRRALCASCDDMYHRHPKRRHHQRQALSSNQVRDERPPLPPKGTPPVPPPRRHKMSGDRMSASPRPPSADQRNSLQSQPAMHTQTMPLSNRMSHPQVPAHLQGKFAAAAAAHLGSMPYLPAQHALALAHAQANTVGHLAPPAWQRPRGSLPGFNVPPHVPMTHDTWDGSENMGTQSWGRPLRRGTSVLELGGDGAAGGGGAGVPVCGTGVACAGCGQCAPGWRYGSCASLDHQPWAGAWGAPACCHPPLHAHAPMHAHAQPHAPFTPQPYRRADSRAASRCGSRAASPAASVRSRASRRVRHRTPSPPLPSSDADSESESDTDRRGPIKEAPTSKPQEREEEEWLGPPPAAPQAPWQCEHCTFVNEPGVRVCAVCCRTPTAPPRVVAPVAASTKTTNDAPSVADSARSIAESARGIVRLELNENSSPAPAAPEPRVQQNGGTKTKTASKKERVSTGCGPSPPREDNSKRQINRLVTPTREQSVEPRQRHDMAVGSSPPREVSSMGVGTSPPRQNTLVGARQPEPKRHSVSVGPSPPREIRVTPVQKFSDDVLDSRSSSTSLRANVSTTGTSPPPQTISTQTYEVPTTWDRSEARSRPRRRFRDDARRERSHSRHSLSSDTRESERSARTSGGGGGGGGGGSSGRWEWRESRDARDARDSSPGGEGGEWSGSERRQPPRLARRASHLDLRRERPAPPRRAHAYRSEAASPEPTRAMSLEALAGRGAHAAAERGLELARLMADAERLGFSAAEVQAALAQSPAAPLSWLRERWPSLCAGVRAAAARLAPRAAVTDLEARAALARHRGAMWPAVTDCVARHRQGDTLTSTEGRMRGRVWGSPAGADDDAAPPRRLRAEDSSDEFDDAPPARLRDDDWMYLPLDVGPKGRRQSDPRDPWGARPTPVDAVATEVALELSRLLAEAGVPTVNEDLLLNDLLFTPPVVNTSVVNPKPNSMEFIQSENDFIDAYNALTRSTPLPSVDNQSNTILPLPESHSKRDTYDVIENHSDSNNQHVINASPINSLPDNHTPERVTDSQNVQNNSLTNIIPDEQFKGISNNGHTEKNPETSSRHNSREKAILDLSTEFTNLQVNATEEILETNAEQTPTKTLNKDPIGKEITTTVKESATGHTTLKNDSENNQSANQITERTSNLNDIVDNTQKLIQLMKDEINSDINSIDDRKSQSEADSTSESDLSSEHGSSYGDTEDKETDELSSNETETSGTESGQEHGQERRPTIIQRTSSEENDQFEEAMDHIEDQIEDFKNTNIDILDSIARSLQEEHTISVQVTQPMIPNGRIQDLNNNRFVEVNSFDEIYDELNTNKKETSNPPRSNKTLNGKSEINFQNNIVKRYNFTKQLIKTSAFEAGLPIKLVFSVINHNALNAIIEDIEDNFVENHDLLSYDEPAYSENETFENVDPVTADRVIVTNNDPFDEEKAIQSNSLAYAQDTLLITNQNNTNVLTSNNVAHGDNTLVTMNQNIVAVVKSTSEDDILSASDKSEVTQTSQSNLILSVNRPAVENNYKQENIVENDAQPINLDININEQKQSENVDTTDVTENTKNEDDINHVVKSERNITPEKSPPSSPSANNTNKSFSLNKSNIPKLVKVITNNKQKSDKTSPKVIVSKVPVRRGSIKQHPAPTPPKTHFGNVQSGHVKQLQTRLFNNKFPKTVVNVPDVVDVKPSTSTMHKKKPAPLPPVNQKRASPTKAAPPKEKKSNYFRESCRTEDEWTESESEELPSRAGREESPARPPSPPPPVTVRCVAGQIIDLAKVRLPEGSPERQARMLLAEGACETWEQARLGVELVARGAEVGAALLAALQCADLAAARAYLQQDCELCAERLPEHEMVSMLRCTHRCCRSCARLYFTVQVSERSIADCVCPYCKLPALEGLPEDEWLEYFAHLDILLKSLLDADVHELFQRKLRDRTLARDPNFRWCVECSSGFFVHPKQKKIRCPECRSVSCAKCRKGWSANHEGVSCEQYAAWLEDNDPERSLAAVTQHLQENGLECPRCHFKYSLSRGGCMHFTCTQCKYEFCYGCGKPFTMGARCGLSEYCAKLGLHAHHPRNCLFYLRDKEPHELQTLLQMNNVPYETAGAESSNNRCPIQLQRETPAGLVDGICGADTPPDYAGLCKAHYVEYLARRARPLDPIPIMDVPELVAELRRRALPLPERGPWDTDPIYAGMCAEIVKEKIPLE